MGEETHTTTVEPRYSDAGAGQPGDGKPGQSPNIAKASYYCTALLVIWLRRQGDLSSCFETLLHYTSTTALVFVRHSPEAG